MDYTLTFGQQLKYKYRSFLKYKNKADLFVLKSPIGFIKLWCTLFCPQKLLTPFMTIPWKSLSAKIFKKQLMTNKALQ